MPFSPRSSVIPVDVSGEIVGHPTAAAAIDAARNHPLQAKARRDGERFKGRRFVDLQATLDRWVLEFTDNLWLRIDIDAGEVVWTVEEERPAAGEAVAPLLLEWPSGEISEIDPSKLASDRRGSEFWQLWVNEVGFHVYLRRRLILWFAVVQRRDDGRRILYVSEDD